MTIARRLILMLALPLVAMAGVGILTRIQLAQIESRTRFISESRIAALATLGNVSRGFTEMRVSVRAYLLARTPRERDEVKLSFDSREKDVARLLQHYADDLVFSNQGRRFLAEYQILGRQWAAGARQVMDLADRGGRDEAIALLNDEVTEVGNRLSQVSSEWIRNNEELANTAGAEAIGEIDNARSKILAGDVGALLLTGMLGFLTIQRIVKPIRALETSVKAVAAGEYKKEVPFTNGTDEIGELARSIDVLKSGAAAMDAQRWVKASAAQLTAQLHGAASLAEFGRRLVSGLVPMLGGGVAAFYLLEEKPGHLRRIAGYGLSDSTFAESFQSGEGLVGQCAADGKPITLTHLPPGYLRIGSAAGAALPTAVLALPLLSQDTLLGVLEVASFQLPGPREKALLDELLPVVALSLEVLQRNLRTQQLLVQTQE